MFEQNNCKYDKLQHGSDFYESVCSCERSVWLLKGLSLLSKRFLKKFKYLFIINIRLQKRNNYYSFKSLFKGNEKKLVSVEFASQIA